jgi:hypothetical protein
MGNNTIVRIGLAVPCPKPPVVAAVAAAVVPAGAWDLLDAKQLFGRPIRFIEWPSAS